MGERTQRTASVLRVPVSQRWSTVQVPLLVDVQACRFRTLNVQQLLLQKKEMRYQQSCTIEIAPPTVCRSNPACDLTVHTPCIKRGQSSD